MTPPPRFRRTWKAKAKEKAMPTMRDEPRSSKVPVVVPNIDKEIEILCKHPYVLNREVGTVFKAWWEEYSTKLTQEELNEMRTILKQGVLLPGRRPAAHLHPLKDLSVYADCWAGCYVFLRCTFERKFVETSIFGHRCRDRFRHASWMPRPSQACLELVRDWSPPSVVKNSNEQVVVVDEQLKRLRDVQTTAGDTSTEHPSSKRVKLDHRNSGDDSKLYLDPSTPDIKDSPSLKLPLRNIVPTKPGCGPTLTRFSDAAMPRSITAQPVTNNEPNMSSEESDEDTDSSSTTDSDTFSVRIIDVKDAPGRSKDEKGTSTTQGDESKDCGARPNISNVGVKRKDANSGTSNEHLNRQMLKLRNKYNEGKRRTDMLQREVSAMKGKLKEADREARVLRNDLNQLRQASKAKEKALEARIEENGKALLKQVEDRVSKIRVTM